MAQTKVEMLTEEDAFLHCNVRLCVQWLVSLLHHQTDGVTNDYMRTETRT
jgi:hypothetical protein